MASAIVTTQIRENRWEPGWRTIAAAVSKTGCGSLVSGILSATATKIVAIVLGPAAVALVSTLQQILQTALSGATFNGQTALIQGASAFTGARRRDYLHTALLLFGIATLVVATLLIAAPGAIARVAGVPPQFANLIRWLAIPVVLSSALTFLVALLRVMGEIGKLALIQTVAALTMALAAWPATFAARSGHMGALVVMLGFSTATALSGAVWATVRVLSARTTLCSIGWHGILREYACHRVSLTAAAARHFFSVSGAMLATSLTGSAILLIIRARITRLSGIATTGEFDAAWGISMSHVSLILTAMQVYYLPVLAKTRSTEDRCRSVASVLTIAILIATPALIGIALFKPVVISVLYSAKFHLAARYLRWTLIGDYLRVTSWVMAMPMLAAADMRAFLAADLSTQAAFLGCSWSIARMRGPAEAAAISFAVSYAVTFGICYLYARRALGFRFGPRLSALWTGGLVLVSAISLGWSAT